MVVISGVLYTIVWSTGFVDSAWSRTWWLFNVAEEFNAPTWLASGLWLILAIVALLVAYLAPTKRWLWVIFALVAAYASLDEAAVLHEQLYRLGAVLAEYLPFDPFSYRWVIGGLALGAVVVAVLIPLVFSLPRAITAGIVIGGAIFLLGAVGMETIGGHVERHFGQVTWHLMLLIHLEELLEYLGVIIATWAVFEMLIVERTDETLQLRFRGYRTDSAPAGA